MTNKNNRHPAIRPFLSRREFLGIIWLGTIVLGIAKITEVLGRTTLPRRPKGKFGGEFLVGTLAELPAANSLPVSYPEGRFWLIRNEEGLFALHRTCTHLDCLVYWDESAKKFFCPCHGSEFGLDGICLKGPAQLPLDRFELRVVNPDGDIVAQTASTGEPLPVDLLLSEGNITSVPVESIVIVDTGRKIQANQNG